ncbi:MAG: amidase [Candidatus Bathyarchaeota archaeon]|nr:MAG: amidase [Candidatus Bathyarchaeota archaeon]
MTTSDGTYANDKPAGDFPVVEASIAEIHGAIREGRTTFREVVEAYLRRIKEYDKPTGLNAIVVVNPSAVERAEKLDDEYRRTGELRPLHGIPVIVKDNYDTSDLQTSAGSIALKGSIPPDDAYQVRALREAGAVVLAKSNMAEWAFSPYETISSIAGTTRNPYDLERVPAGSSGGTAAAVAASFGTVGLGTDTGNSIRGPSSHCCLVGIRSTMGLTSRDGIVPLHLRNDVGGPMARTVEDAVRILEVISGYDPADPITETCIGKKPASYAQYLDEGGLKEAHIGVFRYYTDQPTTDPQIKSLFEKAIEDLQDSGAEIIDPFEIPDFEEISKDLSFETFRTDLESYLASLGEDAPIKTLKEVVDSGKYSPYIEKRLIRRLEAESVSCEDLYNEPRNIAFREAVLEAMDDSEVEAFIYPTWSNPPSKIGDRESPTGDNSQKIPPHTGMPGFTVPMGFTYDSLPAGLQIVGRLFGEPEIIRIAYAFEQATKHRHPPKKFQELG